MRSIRFASLIVAISFLNGMALAQGNLGEAQSTARELERLARAEASKGRNYDKRASLILALMLRGMAESAAGEPAAARSAYSAALSAWPKDMTRTPAITAWRALAHLGLGERAEAQAEQAKLDVMGYRHPTYLRARQMIRTM